METHIDDSTIMETGCKILFQFRRQKIVLNEYHRLGQLALHKIQGSSDGDSISREALDLLHSMVSQTIREQEELPGELNTMEVG